MRICRECKIEKNLNEFYKTIKHKSGYETKCKQCKHLYMSLFIIPKFRSYYRNYSKEWNKNNNEEKKQYERKYWKTKYKIDINFTLKRLLRGQFYRHIKNKNKNIINLLGCTIQEFKNYIESQFKPEMNWDNHGIIWEIDHIKPCSSFDLIDLKQQQECFHYSNTQPLFKTTEIAESFGYKNEIGNKNKYNKY